MKESHGAKIFEEINDRGYAVIPDFITQAFVRELHLDFDGLIDEKKFKKAAVGQGGERKTQPDIRRDEICWINPQENLSSCQRQLFERMEAFKQSLNENLFLGLFDFEMLYSIYNPGAFYKRHSDVFQQDASRVFSTVLYLNENWASKDGGELILYTEDRTPVTIAPRAGTLACFLSHLEHEVKETFKIRRSCAGWFKRRQIK